MSDEITRLEADLAGLTFPGAVSLIRDKLLDPSQYHRAHFAAVLKGLFPYMDYGEIFEDLGYAPGRLGSVISGLHDYREVLTGSMGRRVTLGYHQIDRLTRGIRPGQVAGLMARAGVGKTALAVNIAVNIFRRVDPHPVLFFSLEMPVPEVVARLFCIDNEETAERLDAYLEKSQGDPRLATWARRYQDLVIVDDAGISVKDLETIYGEAEAYLGRRIPLVIVDYLGLLRAPGASSYERMSNLAREIKNTAKRLSCAVIVLVQTSRQGGNGGERVSLTMARDSGAIEEACDFLLGAWRPEISGGADGEMVISILKNRHGATGEFSFFFNKKTLRISGDYDGKSSD